MKLLCILGLVLVGSVTALAQSEAPKLVSTTGGGPAWKNIEELKKYAAKGDPAACFELADRMMIADGVPENLVEARALMEKAAAGGVDDALFRLGKIHHDGLGTAKDYRKAFDYYTQAAKKGVAEAQHNLGAMLVSARGVRRDYVEGLAWLIVAGKNGAMSTAEQQTRQRLAKSPRDIKAAEARAAEILKNPTGVTPQVTFTPPSPSGARGERTALPEPPKVEKPKAEITPPPRLELPQQPLLPEKK